MDKYNFRKAEISEISEIWNILRQAIKQKKEAGSNQWQDGYPNEKVIQKDIEKGVGFVLSMKNTITGYCAILINDEPEYAKIKGKWLTNNDFVVFHRIAVSEKYRKKGLGKKIVAQIENFALRNKIYSIKADTNFDNLPMIKIFEDMGYTLCGRVYFNGSERIAYEKIIRKNINKTHLNF